MEKGMGLNVREEFAGLDLKSSRLEKRFVRSMETLAGQPDKSIWRCSENRAEASETKFPQRHTGCRATSGWTAGKSCGLTASRRSGG